VSAVSFHPILALPAQLVAELPEPMLLRLHVPGAPVPVCMWTGSLAAETRAALPVLADTIVFDGAELSALALATEADRLWHADFLGMCFEKWRKPETRINGAQALAGANPDPSMSFTLDRAFRRLGIEIESVEFDMSSIAAPMHAAA
jgi:hypothetical protein